MEHSYPYIGIDGCRSGWLYVAIDSEGDYEFGVLSQFSEVDRFLPSAKQILVDIPIGLPSSGQKNRVCDTEARKVISPRGSCVFPAPARSALYKDTYKEGSEENHRVLGRKLSRQSWGISPKIREVDEYLRSKRPGRIIREMHPEVAFCALSGGKALLSSKKTGQGVRDRLGILQSHWRQSKEALCDAMIETLGKGVAIDDIIDAMAGAVTARYQPNIIPLPKQPLLDEEGLPMEIVCWAGSPIKPE